MDRQQNEKRLEETAEIVRRRQVHVRKSKSAATLVATVMTRRAIAATKTNQQLTDRWQTAVGVKIAKKTRLGNVKRGVLDVTVANSVLLQELRFEKQNILKKLNLDTAHRPLKDIRFQIGQVS